MTDEWIVAKAKEAEQRKGVYSDLVHSPKSRGVNSAYGIGFIDGMVEYRDSLWHGANGLVSQIWHKESEHPNNRHPYPVLNPDGEMAFAYYDELSGWQFDRDFKHSVNMMWLDIERILPKKED